MYCTKTDATSSLLLHCYLEKEKEEKLLNDYFTSTHTRDHDNGHTLMLKGGGGGVEGGPADLGRSSGDSV